MPVVKFPLYLDERGIDVDLFLAETPFQRELLRRRRREQINGIEAWLVSPEDLVLLEPVAGRPRDRADIADIRFVQGERDEDYLRKWAALLGFPQRWRRSCRKSPCQHPAGRAPGVGPRLDCLPRLQRCCAIGRCSHKRGRQE